MTMKSIGWDNCPKATQDQVQRILTGFQERLGNSLIGIYLHGSLAMSCFNPEASDVDLLALVRHKIPPSIKKAIIEFLLSVSGAPHPLEISFLRQKDVIPWQFPTPFDLHFSEEWRARYFEDIATEKWKLWDAYPQRDPDLAAHIMITRHRGICLCGMPVEKAFPLVPRQDYLESLISDLVWTLGRLPDLLVYGVLNSCRVYAYLLEGHIFSKAEGAAWALTALAPEFHPTIRTALEMYRGDRIENVDNMRENAERMMKYVLSKAKIP
jgi:hypothetical protein